VAELIPFSVVRVSPLLPNHAEGEYIISAWFPVPCPLGPTLMLQPLTDGMPSIITAIMSASLCIG
jgi:hypothetical protein